MVSSIPQKKSIVLVVDDDPAAVGALSQLLDSEGHAVLVALEGLQAMTITKNIIPDIILMDANMPVMDGFDTCASLKANPDLEHVPVMFMTGLSDTENVIKGFEAGGIDYITKPINHSELIVRMHAHLANARMTMSARNALDTSGHYLFSAQKSGAIRWATPLAHQALQSLGVSTDGCEVSHDNELSFNRKISQLINADIKSKKGVVISQDANKFEVRFVRQVGPDEYLLRIFDLQGDSDIEILKKSFVLTNRESEVLLWISQGKTNREVGLILSMSPRTANKHLEQIYKKLGVENRTAAAAVALGELGKNN